MYVQGNFIESRDRRGRMIAAASLLAFILAGASMAQAQGQQPPTKVCVAMVKNTSNYSVNTRLQQSRLARDFNNAKKDKKGKLATVEAVALDSETHDDASAEARDKGCDYVLLTNVVRMRAAGDQRQPNQNPPGNISIGRDPITAYPGATEEPVYEAQVDFQVYKVGELEPVLGSTTSTIEQSGNEDTTVSATLDIIVSRVRAALGKR